MRRIISLCLFAILISACGGNIKPNIALLSPMASIIPAFKSANHGLVLPPVFDEEFNGASLDFSKWNTQLSWGRTNPPELQYYSPAAFGFDGNNIRITARRESTQGKKYTSGVITTYNSFQFTYGYVEARMRIPSGKGFWPALWMLDRSGTADEIDISEILGHEPATTYMTLHYDTGSGVSEIGGKYIGPNFSTDYHIFAVDWSPSAIVWYVDGIERYRITDHIPSKPMYLIANLAVGGNWPGNPDSSTVFPAYYDIDYIRVYRNDFGPSPAAVSMAASSVTATGAILNGLVNAINNNTTVTFQYGPTTAYGSSAVAVQSPVSGSSNISVNYQLTGLMPKTTYHFRVVTTSDAGVVYGLDQVFKTQDVIVTLEIHDPTDTPLNSAAIGEKLHGMATVIGREAPITGTVVFRVFNNPSCAGDGKFAGTVKLNSGGVADPSLSAPMTINGLSFKAHYAGDNNYLPSDGLCKSISTSSYPTVLTLSTNTVPQDQAILTSSVDYLNVQFNMDVRHGNMADLFSADNTANYLLVEPGANRKFDTTACGPVGVGGLKSDDAQIDVNFVSYDPKTFIATLIVNDGIALQDGSYRLFICGTISIISSTNATFLNNHLADSLINFTVVTQENEKKHKNLPATGFAPSVTVSLPAQPIAEDYTDEAMWLEIPSLDLKAPVVGVPENPDWDTTWLGTRIGYLQGTAFPTWNGNSVLVGHVANSDGKPGPFANLYRLLWGDKIIIRAWGQQYIYEVRSIDLWADPNSTSVLTKHEELPWLTLITCHGYDEKTNTYRWRTIVRGVLVQIKYQ